MERVAALLHILGVTIWVGGMFFAYMALRPAAVQTLEPPQRLTLWAATFKRFFPWVWLCIIAILGSGLYRVGLMGGFGAAGNHVLAMLTLGIVMMLVFFHVFFAPTRRLQRGVAAQDWKAAGAALAQIRILIGLNLSIGILVIFTATVGRLLF